MSNLSRFYFGQALFGLLVGLLVGLSVSEIVTTFVGLLFAFIGGSIIVLIKDRKETELAIIGSSISVISISIIVGVSAGMYLRIFNPFEIKTSPVAPYKLTQNLSIEDIKTLGANKEYAELICNLIKSRNIKEPENLNIQQLNSLIKNKVDKKVLNSMLITNTNCSNSISAQKIPTINDGINLKSSTENEINDDSDVFTPIFDGTKNQ